MTNDEWRMTTGFRNSSLVIRHSPGRPLARAIAGRQTENKKETRDASLFCDIDWQQLMAIRF